MRAREPPRCGAATWDEQPDRPSFRLCRIDWIAESEEGMVSRDQYERALARARKAEARPSASSAPSLWRSGSSLVPDSAALAP
jgi:hypothetical protein